MTLISLSKGVEKKLVRRGKNNFGLHARKFPLRDFPPPGHDFCPRLGIPFQYFLFLSLGWPSLQGGTSGEVLRLCLFVNHILCCERYETWSSVCVFVCLSEFLCFFPIAFIHLLQTIYRFINFLSSFSIY